MGRRTIRRSTKIKRKFGVRRSMVRRSRLKKGGGDVEDKVVDEKNTKFTNYAYVTFDNKIYVIQRATPDHENAIRFKFIAEKTPNVQLTEDQINNSQTFMNMMMDNKPQILNFNGILNNIAFLVEKRKLVFSGFDAIKNKKNILRNTFWNTLTFPSDPNKP